MSDKTKRIRDDAEIYRRYREGQKRRAQAEANTPKCTTCGETGGQLVAHVGDDDELTIYCMKHAPKKASDLWKRLQN